jgi:predicted phosphoribosyltransferase
MAGRTVIVVDDGLATGATMAAALQAARLGSPARLVCAVPVAARESLAAIAPLADEVVCLAQPSPFYAVGAFYDRFDTVYDVEVVAALGACSAGDPDRRS